MPDKAKTRYQKYEVAIVARSTIHGAPYNPRQIDAHALKKLRENIRRVGMLGPIIVNKRTHNIVSGHQRLVALDVLEGEGDYHVEIAYCDLSDKEEREQNLFMNNEAAQGSWNVEALNQLLSMESLDISLAGFESADLQLLIPEWTPPAIAEAAPENETLKEEDEVTAMAAKIDEIKAAKKRSKEAAAEQDDTGFFLVTVFQDRAEMDAFLDKLKIDRRQKYVSPAVLLAAVSALLQEEKSVDVPAS